MKNKLFKITALFALLTQTACITTVHTDPYHPRSRTVYAPRPRPVYIPVPAPRPAPTVVTVRRYAP